jgi:hypothetical protein
MGARTIQRMLSTTSGLHPNRMRPGERLDELASLLAAALIRLRSPKSSGISGDDGESFVDFTAHRSGHARHSNREAMTQ